MEAIFKIQPAEFNETLFNKIKSIVKGKPVIITISTEIDETAYLNSWPANREYILENIASEPTVSFTPEEFDKHIEMLLKQAD